MSETEVGSPQECPQLVTVVANDDPRKEKEEETGNETNVNGITGKNELAGISNQESKGVSRPKVLNNQEQTKEIECKTTDNEGSVEKETIASSPSTPVEKKDDCEGKNSSVDKTCPTSDINNDNQSETPEKEKKLSTELEEGNEEACSRVRPFICQSSNKSISLGGSCSLKSEYEMPVVAPVNIPEGVTSILCDPSDTSTKKNESKEDSIIESVPPEEGSSGTVPSPTQPTKPCTEESPPKCSESKEVKSGLGSTKADKEISPNLHTDTTSDDDKTIKSKSASPSKGQDGTIESLEINPTLFPEHKDKLIQSNPVPDTSTPGHHTYHHNPKHQAGSNKKGSKIPVGIAVAWQRLVTSNSPTTSTTTITSLTNSALGKPTMSKPSKEKVHPKEVVSPMKIPTRPSSSSPTHVHCHPPEDRKTRVKVTTDTRGFVSTDRKRSDADATTKIVTPELVTTRPMPSSSVPPNLGLSYFHHPSTSLLDYQYGLRSVTPFPHSQPNGQFSLPPTWQTPNPLSLISDLTLPQGFPSSGGFMQGPIQSQVPLHHLGDGYGGYSYLGSTGGFATLRHHYEQLFRQQQSEFLRHFHLSQDQLLGSGLYHMNEGLRTTPTIFPPNPSPRLSIPLLSPSPTAGTRIPTPNSGFTPTQQTLHSLPVLPSTTTTWPSDFPHNSSAALSPKSLTSSSPSPVTVQHYHQSYQETSNLINTVAGSAGTSNFIGRNKGSSPATNRENASQDKSCSRSHVNKNHDPMSPQNIHETRVEDDGKTLRTKGMIAPHTHREHGDFALVDNFNSSRLKKGNVPRSDCEVPSYSSPSSLPEKRPSDVSKHDFKRLDSLIEKRKGRDENTSEISFCDEISSVHKTVMKEDTREEDTAVSAMNLSKREIDPSPAVVSSEVDVNQNLSIVAPKSQSPKNANSKKSSTNKKVACNKDEEKIPKQRKQKRPKQGPADSTNENHLTGRKPEKVSKSHLGDEGRNSTTKRVTPSKTKQKKNSAGEVLEALQFKKQGKPRVYKPKKLGMEDRDLHCDESFNKGNNVPESNLPVATSNAVTLDNKVSDSELGNRIVASAREGSSSSKSPFRTNSVTTEKVTKKRSKRIPKEKEILEVKPEKQKPSKNKKEVKVGDAVKRKRNQSANSNKKVGIEVKPKTTKLILPASLPQTSTNYVGTSTYGSPKVTLAPVLPSSSSYHQVSSVIPVQPSYQNPPVTLILPRALPQVTVTNSHQQTSFKLVVSSQEIKIPAFASNSSSTTIEGTIQLHHQQQNFSTLHTTMTSTLPHRNSCDDSDTANRDNTITFIRDSSLIPSTQVNSPSHNVNNLSQSALLPNTQNGINVVHSQQPKHFQDQPTFSSYLSPPPTLQQRQTVVGPKDFHMDHNHLNLLASVASEFGSRDDLGRLASHSSSSRGSSLMASPVLSMQSSDPTFPTPSSTASSSLTASSISLPSSPVNSSKFTSKSPHDEYEYDEKEHGSHEVNSGSYKHSVWLKIPQIVPQAANKVAEKQKKIQLKKEKEESIKSNDRKSKAPEKNQRTKLKQMKGNTKKRAGESENYSNDLKIPSISVASAFGGREMLNSPTKKEKSKPMKKASKRFTPGSGISMTNEDHTHKALHTPKAKRRTNLLGVKEAKVDGRRSGEDKVKLLAKHKKPLINSTSGISADKPFSSKDTPERETHNISLNSRNKMGGEIKSYEGSDNNQTQLSTSKNLVSGPKNLKLGTNRSYSSNAPKDLFSSSITALTPPPTAKPLLMKYESDLKIIASDDATEGKEVASMRPKAATSWVSDPMHATSALSGYRDDKSTISVNQEKVTTGISAQISSDEDEEEILLDFERRSAERMRNEIRPSLFGLFNKNEKSGQSFVPYSAPKREAQDQQHSHHIKPRLQAEPVLRPSNTFSDEDESENDADLEVASLTNSIQHPKTKSDSSRRRESHSGKPVTKNATQPSRGEPRGKTNMRRFSCATVIVPKEHKRRLSLNLQTGKTRSNKHDGLDDLLEIGEGSKTGRTTHSYNATKNKASMKNQQIKKPRLSAEKQSSGSGTLDLVCSGLPKKRSSRSQTTSSKSSVASSVASRSRLGGRRGSSTSKVTNDVEMNETQIPGKVELESVEEFRDEMRILTEIQGLFYTGKLNALHPPDVYGVTLDNERGTHRPHLIFSAEEVKEKCVREKNPQTLTVGLRICAYWSPQYSGLYPGRVSTDFNPHFDPEKDLIPIEFDDGDTGMIKLGEIRMLPQSLAKREYDPNPLLTLERKHRKRRHSSSNTNSGECTGDHEETDCGESYCAKVAKYDEEMEDGEDDVNDSQKPYKSLYWTWTGLGYKRSKAKKSRNKEFFRGIQRGDEVVSVGDSAIFISHGNERPYIGRIEKFWEIKGQKIVHVRWFYHPEEVKNPKRIPHLKHSGALFESPHIDENDVQTIAKKCNVVPYTEFKEMVGRIPKSLKNSGSTKPKDLYYIAGFYDPYTYNLQMKI